MEWLLIGVFSFFGIHTLLWLYRSLRVNSAARGPGGDAGRSTDGDATHSSARPPATSAASRPPSASCTRS